MNFRGSLHLGRRYLRRQRGKTALLVGAITLSLFLPVAIFLLVDRAEAHLRARAEATPLALGAAGSPLELVFTALYFADPELPSITMVEARDAGADGLATVVPMYATHEARGFRIVGTTLDYFHFRGLEVAAGAPFGRLGDCVLGAVVARDLGLGPGDHLVSTPEQAFDLAGVYPLRMRITGVLAPTGNADDRGVFVDLKTTWIIDGLAHGHDTPPDDADTVLERGPDGLVLNAAVREFVEVTPQNVDSFHFHGDPAGFPISAAIVLPRDEKADTILRGRYVGDRPTVQLVRPDAVMANLFATVFRIRDLVVAALVMVGVMAAVIATLVFLLSNRLRAEEFSSLAHLGADRGSVRLLVGFEALFVLITSVLLAGGLLAILSAAIPGLLPMFTS